MTTVRATSFPPLVTSTAELAARLAADSRLADRIVARPHPLLVVVRQDRLFVVLAAAAVWERRRDVLRPFGSLLAEGSAVLILLGRPAEPDLTQALNRGLAALVPAAPGADELFVAVHGAFELLEAKARAESRGKWLNRYRYELGELIEIAKAISTEREIDKLLGLILEKSRFITGADAGSIYVVEGDDPEPFARTLRFKLSQNASVIFDSREFTVPVSPRSMSGYVALHRKPLNIADVYDLPALAPYGFDRSFDAKIGYRTKSMLCAPLLSRVGDVVGVLPAPQQEARPRAQAPHRRGRERAGGALRRAQRAAPRDPRLPGRDRAGERHPLRRDRAHAGGVRAR